ncbi:MAG TPA: hypothetical protein VGF67_33705 [Ktedonobacteraceae bacterium]
MARLSRRRMLILAAAGAGEVGALAASAAAGAHFAPASAASATIAQSPAVSAGQITRGPLAAFVPDAQGDTLVIMRGEQEITITNPALVQTLLSFSAL